MGKPLIVQIESPFAGDIPANIAYARACIKDSIERGEAPFASHLLYTQPGVLEDDNPEQRKLGIETGWAFMRVCDRVVFYTDRGMSSGMEAALRRAQQLGVPTETRTGIKVWSDHEYGFPEVEETDKGAIRRIVRGLRTRWAMRTPVLARETALAIADQIERDELE